MKLHLQIPIVCIAALLLVTIYAHAQQRPGLASRISDYNADHEIVLQGTVLAYAENSSVPPIGAHVTIQTSNGSVDVHLGPASYLKSNHFSFAAGDSARFVGIPTRRGGNLVFLARIAQKGNHAVTIRSSQGFLFATAKARSMCKAAQPQEQQVAPR